MTNAWMNLVMACMTTLAAVSAEPLWEENARPSQGLMTESDPVSAESLWNEHNSTARRLLTNQRDEPLLWDDEQDPIHASRMAAAQDEIKTQNMAVRMAHLRHSNASPAYEANSRIAGQTHKKIILVLDRMDENHAVIETPNGTFFIPKEILPHEMQKEGTVFELHHVPSLAEKKLVQAQARLERMQVVTL